jgi:hypothetical protein
MWRAVGLTPSGPLSPRERVRVEHQLRRNSGLFRKREADLATSLRTIDFFQQLEAEHCEWLSHFDSQYLNNWRKLLNSDEEAAFAEARVRQLMEGYGVTVQPNESLTGATQCPDFRCATKGSTFYVEVTCIPTSVAAEKTGIPNGSHAFSWIRPLNDAIFSKCQGKALQCRGLDAPSLVVVGTFHNFAAMASFSKPLVNWVLTGEAKLTWDINMHTGSAGEPYEITELHSAAFLRPDRNEEVGYARSSISGLLLSGFTWGNRPFIGVLHPNAARPFDPATLPQVEFGRVIVDRSSGQLQVDWPEGDDE